jgi:3-oxoacyl-[acyl-carrier protein] reductase
MPAELRLGGYRVLLTGATGGIGRAIASALAGAGARLALSGRRTSELRGLVQQLSDRLGDARAISADLEDPDAAAALPGRAAEAMGGLDCVINNAGLAMQMPVERTDLASWDRMLAINARAPFLICREATPYLARSPRARVVNISSVVGRKGYENQSAYAASKHALEGFTKVYAREVHALGIGVHIIAPGGVDTPMVSEMRPDIDADGLIAPGEIAEAVLFLLGASGNACIDRIDVRRWGKKPWS